MDYKEFRRKLGIAVPRRNKKPNTEPPSAAADTRPEAVTAALHASDEADGVIPDFDLPAGGAGTKKGRRK
jgi:hypothetical protein